MTRVPKPDCHIPNRQGMLEQQSKIDRSQQEAERRKWDSYYESLPLVEEDDSTRRFNEQFVERVSAFLPEGSEVLEAGCGAGWQSLALARSGRFNISVMDFSAKALDYSRRVFERQHVTARFLEGDIRDPGAPAFDLVFNAGVLEHYTFEEQAALIRGMAGFSRRYVLGLVPNALCYWYWLWRIQKATCGDWPFGKEVPLANLSAVFREAGLQFCGQMFLGDAWSESFIEEVPGMDPALREQILRIHRSPVIPAEQRSYLVAALGSVSPTDGMPQGWAPAPSSESMATAELRAIFADTLAGRIATETQLAWQRRDFEIALREAERRRSESALEAEALRAFLKTEREAWEITLHAAREELRLTTQTLREELRQTSQTLREELRQTTQSLRRVLTGLQRFQVQFEKHLAQYRGERAWWIMAGIRKAYVLLARRKFAGILPFMGWMVRAALGRSTDLNEYAPVFPDLLNYVPKELIYDVPKELIAPKPSAPPPRPKRKAIQKAAKPDRRYDIVVLPIFDFDFRFQRPQQIAVQFARNGHRVFWISPTRMLPLSSAAPFKAIPLRENVWEIHLRAAPFDLYGGALTPAQAAARIEALAGLYRDMDLVSSCAILQFPFWRQIGLGLREKFGARLVYDCMDDWQNWPTEPLPGAFSLSEEKTLAREADVLVVTSRGLRDRYAADEIDSILIPNAADFEFFRDAPEDSSLADLPRPVIGYYGAIADWFDLELMAEVIRSRPQYTFVLIGQVHVSGVSALRTLPNAHLLGEKPYSELPGYLGQFDVCTLPFRMNQLTEAVDPVKIYEYLSQGKPVVSVPLPELAPLSELVYFATGPEEFLSQIDRALAETDLAVRQKRIAFASENTWSSRIHTLDRTVRERFPLVSLLVVTYNSREFLEPFLDSLRRNTSYPCYEVIVVDNHSSDGSAGDLKRYAEADPHIRLHCLQENLGFAGGNNFAARMAEGEYIVLLNPDTILTAEWLERLMRPLETDPGIGMVAPVTNFSGNETKVNADYMWLSEMEEFAAERRAARSGETFEVDVIPLFCGLLRRKLWDEVGGLDESFKVGTFEDDDFSLRVRKAGYRLVTAEDCFIHHFGNGSFGKLQTEAFDRIFNLNRKRFESKWDITWVPHKTRPGVRPVSEESRIPFGKFFEEDSGSGN
jgi:GT2 family glycosyltransferase/SAM-dependent methyltransferase